MPSETEIKYSLKSTDEFLKIIRDDSISPFITKLFAKNMSAEYFDTADGFLNARRAALRLRREGDELHCCLKSSSVLKDGIFTREEYECNASSLRDGIFKLAQCGAPESIINKLASEPLVSVCKMEFKREGWLFSKESITAEFDFDVGVIKTANGNIPISELEIELKSGDVASFTDFCRGIGLRFDLLIEEQSKLARALNTNLK